MACARLRDITLQIQHPKQHGDNNAQLELLKEAIEKNPVGIATSIVDSEKFLPVIKRARSKNIPIVILDTKSKPRQLEKNLAHTIGIDDYRIGQLVAKKITDSTCRKHIVYIDQDLKIRKYQMRAKGAKHIFDNHHLKLTAFKVDINNPVVLTFMVNFIKQHASVDCVIISNGYLLRLMETHLAQIKCLNSAKNLMICAFDKTNTAVNLLRDGVLDFFVDTRPYLQGYMSIMKLKNDVKVKPQIVHNPAKKTSNLLIAA